METKKTKPFIAEKASAHDEYFERTDLTEVIIPAGVTKIGWYAFRGCSGLTSVEIPADAEIGDVFPPGVCIRRKKTDGTD